VGWLVSFFRSPEGLTMAGLQQPYNSLAAVPALTSENLSRAAKGLKASRENSEQSVVGPDAIAGR
jgi:hypothetical protein